MKLNKVSGEANVISNFVYDSYKAFSRLKKGLHADDKVIGEVQLELPVSREETIPVGVKSKVHAGYFIVQSKVLSPDGETLNSYDELVMRADPENQGKNLKTKEIKTRLNVITRAVRDSVTDQLEQLISQRTLRISDYDQMRSLILKTSPVPVESDILNVPFGFNESNRMDLLEMGVLMGTGLGRNIIFGTPNPGEEDAVVLLGAKSGTVFEHKVA